MEVNIIVTMVGLFASLSSVAFAFLAFKEVKAGT